MLDYKKFYKKKRILITGISGFKGSWLANWLDMLGAKVFGFANTSSKNCNLFKNLKLKKRVNFKVLDICNFKLLNDYVKFIKPQIIFHLASQPLITVSYKEPLNTFQTNILGTLNILEVFRLNVSIKSLICVTSDKCYESKESLKYYRESDRLGGVDPYSVSKVAADIIANSYYYNFFYNKFKNNKALSIVRPGNVIGGGDWSQNRLIPDCIRSLLKNKTIILRKPHFNRPWQHVLETIYGYLVLAMKQFHNPKYFSGSWNFGPNVRNLKKVKDIVKIIVNCWGSGKFKVKKSRNKTYEQKNLQLNINKAVNKLGWKPFLSIEKSLMKTIDWYLQVCKYNKDPLQVTNNQIVDFMNEIK